MIVGEQMIVVGTIEGDEDLVVRGRVEGAVRIGGTLTVEAGALVAAAVRARAVMVYGMLQGDAVADERIEVAPGGAMMGDACAPRVAIVSGAAFRGRVDMGQMPEVPAHAPPTMLAAGERSRLLGARAPEPAPPVAATVAAPPAATPPVERRRTPRAPAPSDGPRVVPRLAVPTRGPLRRRTP